MPADVDVLLFDLGGVLLDLNDPAQTFGVEDDVEPFLVRWIRSPAVRDFERGAIDASTFALRVMQEAGLDYSPAEFLARFDAWPGELYEDVPALLDQLSGHYRCALLSNTNAGHWGRAGIESELAHRFERLYLSFETGRLKPDPDSFQQVIDDFGVTPDRVLFFDDNPVNVHAARACGLRAELVRGGADLRRVASDLMRRDSRT